MRAVPETLIEEEVHVNICHVICTGAGNHVQERRSGKNRQRGLNNDAAWRGQATLQ
jgi:hypothetical protein